MAISEPETQARGSLRWYLLGAGAVVLVVTLFLVFGSKKANTSGDTRDKNVDNPLETARRTLSRETDLESCRSALSQFNTYLTKDEKRLPPSLTEAERKDLRERFDLDGGELAEVDANTFTQLDSHYLDLCFLMRDAASALDVEVHTGDESKKRPAPLRQAQAAFGWAMRQVRLEKVEGPPLPVQFALRRGWGTDLERALVFLELLRHVGTADERLTGCLVYCPNKDGEQRLWACGVLVNDKPDLYLFDPRLGMPLPGPKGNGIATLNETRTEATVLGQLTVDKTKPYDVTPEQAAKAELRYVCNLTALAPRMKLLQSDLAPAVKVRLTVNAGEELKRLETAKVPVQRWLDGKASGASVLRRFLPPTEGGVDQSKPITRRDFFTLGIVPFYAMPSKFLDENNFPPRVGLGQRVRVAFAQPFLRAALEPHRTRDELLRGHYDKAIPELIETRSNCQDALNRLSQEKKNENHEKEFHAWIDKAISAYAEQKLAGGNPQRLAEANRKVEALWSSQESRVIGVELEGSRSVPQQFEVLFQLGLCKHEQAERMQMRSELSPDDEELAQRTGDAWKEAVNVWQQFLDEYKGHPAAGSAARLLGTARLRTGDLEGALRTWRLELPAAELEKVGSLYLAKTNEK